MASSKQVLVLVVVAAVACLASQASATVWMVGDDGGWRANFNQTGWADGKTFVVGDILIFIYNENHTLAQVHKDDFATCNLQGKFLSGPFDSGYVKVTLLTPGKLWVICTKPNHCDGGMKLAIDVVGGTTAPVLPVAAPPSAAVRSPVGGAVAAAAAAVVAAALAF